jgi:hypothetical protein
MIARAVFLATALCASSAHAEDTRLTQPVERASADDCAIFVEIGKTQLNWRAAPPNMDFFPVWDRDGGGTYLEECPWTDLGVAEPTIGSPKSERSFFITRPKYVGRRATVVYAIALGGPGHIFRSDHECKLEKRRGVWRVVTCELLAIT